MTKARKHREYILTHYGKDKTRDIALVLGLTPVQVRGLAHNLGMRYQKREARPRSCRWCKLYANGHCIYGNEGDASRCRSMRYTRGEWPKEKTPIQELFELI